MRHKRIGRRLGRSSSHRKALFQNMASALILTERDDDFYEGMFQSDGKTPVKPPAIKGRIVTTLPKAKEARPVIERCITVAKRALPLEKAAAEFGTTAERNSEQWIKWRKSDQWRKWSAAMAPVVKAKRRAFQMLRNKDAVRLLFNEIAPRFADRPGGYTRILKLSKSRLGDGGDRAIIEFVGVHDRIKKKAQRPQFESEKG
jgi:large subunit ribosomal protein L17